MPLSPSTLWIQNAPGDRQRADRPERLPGRRGHLDPRPCAHFFIALSHGRGLLRGQPQASFSLSTPAGPRLVLWDGLVPGDESGGGAPVRHPCPRPDRRADLIEGLLVHMILIALPIATACVNVFQLRVAGSQAPNPLPAPPVSYDQRTSPLIETDDCLAGSVSSRHSCRGSSTLTSCSEHFMTLQLDTSFSRSGT